MTQAEARMAAHRHFDLLWKFGYMSRDKAYSWLAATMNLPKKDAHILLFNQDQCAQLIKEVEKFWRTNAAS